MHVALRATSRTIERVLRTELASGALAAAFGGAGSAVVSIDPPQTVLGATKYGVSVWLYRIERDEMVLNAPPRRPEPGSIERSRLPLRLHYLVTPMMEAPAGGGDAEVAALDQEILGRVLQILQDRPVLRGGDLTDMLEGADLEIALRLEPLSLDESLRLWSALDQPYRLSVSYEASITYVDSARPPEHPGPVEEVAPGFSIVVGSQP